MIDFVRFDNDLPGGALVVGLDHEPPVQDVGLETACAVQHGAEVDLGEVSILNALLGARPSLRSAPSEAKANHRVDDRLGKAQGFGPEAKWREDGVGGNRC